MGNLNPSRYTGHWQKGPRSLVHHYIGQVTNSSNEIFYRFEKETTINKIMTSVAYAPLSGNVIKRFFINGKLFHTSTVDGGCCMATTRIMDLVIPAGSFLAIDIESSAGTPAHSTRTEFHFA